MTTLRAPAVLASIAGAIAAISLMLFEPRLAAVSCLLGWTMLAIAASDAERFIVPDVLSLPSIPAGLVVTHFVMDANAASALVLEHCIAAAVGVAALYAVKQLYLFWRGREGLGLGDVKLAAVAGAWTGLQGLSRALLLACVLAIAYVVLGNLRNLRSVEGNTAVPLGVFLGPSIWLVWCVGMLALQTELAAIGPAQ
jgi:leader peptidase (prepilin peptidase)/N-methyltransferase